MDLGCAALARFSGAPVVVVMDLPLADGGVSDHQPRLAVAGDPWAGEVAVLKSSDGESFERVATVRAPAVIGRSETSLPPGAPGRWQRVSWEVTLATGAVSSALSGALLNGANLLALELPDGEWELVQFRDAELIGTDRYRLQTLLRGLRGTDVLSNSALAAGARIVLLDDAVIALPVEPHEIGLERSWKIGPAEYDQSHPSYVTLNQAWSGAGLRPFAPAHLQVRPTNGNLVVDWVRTTRIGGERLEAVEVPMGEADERYRLTVRQGGTILRTVDLAGPGFTYTAAMQVVDGAVGTVEIGVARLSATYGYGPERVVTANV